jgi:hypothetical protein
LDDQTRANSVNINMNLIIVSTLLDTPPSDNLAIRYVTMEASGGLSLPVLVEVEQDMKDLYYSYMKKLGLMDFVDQYVTPEESEEGIRVDTELKYPMTIRANNIRFDNTLSILGQIKSLQKTLS